MELVAIILVIAVVIAAEVLIFGKYALKGIYYSASVNKTEVYEGETLELTEVVENRRFVALPWIKTELSASRWLAFSRKDSAAQTSGGDNTFSPGVFSLKPRSKCTRVRKIKCLKRGVFSFDDTAVTATDMLGLVKVSKGVKVGISITVLPVASDGEDAILSFNEPVGEILVRRFINEDPFMISGSKEYTGREPLNRINWKYTAITGKLMAMNNEFTTSRNTLIVMNMQRKGVVPVTSADIRDTEAFIKLAVKLIWDSVDNGCGCAFATNGGNVGGTASGFIKTAEQCEGTLRMLAQLSDSCSFDFGSFLNALNYGSFTDVIILTPYIDNEMTTFVNELKGNDIEAVFYTTGNIPENADGQILHARKFSYTFNTEYGEGTT